MIRERDRNAFSLVMLLGMPVFACAITASVIMAPLELVQGIWPFVFFGNWALATICPVLGAAVIKDTNLWIRLVLGIGYSCLASLGYFVISVSVIGTLFG